MLDIRNNRRDFERERLTTAVLPLGAIEQHGSHLPVGMDIVLAAEIAGRLAEALNAYLLPAMPITSSIEHRKGHGTVYIRATTLAAILSDVAASLQEAGFRRLILVGGHGGNWIVKPTIRQVNREWPAFEVLSVDLSSIATHRLGEILEYPDEDVHAGEMETSVMLYLDESSVGEIRQVNGHAGLHRSFMDQFDVTEMTGDGYWGRPESATKDKGRRVLELMLDCSLAYIRLFEQQKDIIESRQNG